MKKFFIPGGAGYIGSVLTAELLKQGHQVWVIDNLMYGQNGLTGVSGDPNLHFEKADFCDESAWKEGLAKADVVIPLAAIVGAPACDRLGTQAEEINQHAPLRFFSKVSKSQMLLMPTTNSAYGSGDANNQCHEGSPLNPISSYARMKVEVEKKLLEFSNAISFRLATVFGLSPRMRLDLLVNDFAYRGYRDRKLVLFEPHFKRNYIHVRDVVRCFVHAVDHFDEMKGQIYNVGLSSANLSKRELAERIGVHVPGLMIEEEHGKKDPDQRNYIVSNAKIEKTGFLPKYDLDFGIQEIIREHRSLDGQTMRNY